MEIEKEQIIEREKQLKTLRKRHEKVCEKLDILNLEATNLENEIQWLESYA